MGQGIGLAFSAAVLLWLGASPAFCGEDRSIPTPPGLPGPPTVRFTTYPAVAIGDPPQAAPRVLHRDVHYRYTPQSVGLLAYVNQRPDCGPTAAALRIIEPPKSGTMLVTRAPPPPDVHSDFWAGPSDPRKQCDATKGLALWVRYVPASGSSARDSSVVEIVDGLETWRFAVWIERPPH